MLVALLTYGSSSRALAQDDSTPPSAQGADDSADDPTEERPEDEPGDPPEDPPVERYEESESEDDPFDDLRPDTVRPQTTDSGPIGAMSEEELRDAGFVFSDRDRNDLGSTGTILALTLGSAVHGVGHLYVGDSSTGYFLVIMEAVSIAAIIGSGSYSFLSGNANSGVVLSSGLFKFGVATFFASWALDILGTLQGDDLVFALNRGPERGLAATIGYRLVDVAETPVDHAFDLGLNFDNDWLIAQAGTTQDVLLDFQQYRGLVGSRPLVGPSRLSWLGAQIDATYSRYTGTGEFGQLDVNARVNWSAGLAAISPSFDKLSVGGSLGWGRRYLQIPDETNTLTFTDSRGRFLFDLHGDLGVTDRLTARVGYRTADGLLLPATSSLIGNTYFDLVYRTDGFGDLIFGAAISEGVMLNAGGRLWLWR